MRWLPGDTLKRITGAQVGLAGYLKGGSTVLATGGIAAAVSWGVVRALDA
jgi:hypothetical protein